MNKNAQLRLLLVLFAALFFTGCTTPNRYLRNYSGEKYPKSEQCELVNAELKYYAEGTNFQQQLEAYKNSGFEVIGMSPNDVVVKCKESGATTYMASNYAVTGFGASNSSCTQVQLDKKNQKWLRKACRAVGASIALYDSQKILFFR